MRSEMAIVEAKDRFRVGASRGADAIGTRRMSQDFRAIQMMLRRIKDIDKTESIVEVREPGSRRRT